MRSNDIPSPIIEVDALKVQFGDRVIFEDVSFGVERGEILVILGGSGCGKSTLMRTMAGLVVPALGAIRVEGDDIVSAPEKKKNEILRKFGIMFQSGGLFASMTLAENVALPLQSYTGLDDDEIEELVRLKLALVGLNGFEDFLPSEISGGMKKRAGLARALALDPPILCFDEPSAGLDPRTSAALDELIRELNVSLGTTMVVVTHELDSIYGIADRAVMLDRSARGVIAIGKPQELRYDKGDMRVYNFFNRVP